MRPRRPDIGAIFDELVIIEFTSEAKTHVRFCCVCGISVVWPNDKPHHEMRRTHLAKCIPYQTAMPSDEA